MRTAGIICEYNPFHAGHAHHIECTRRETGADLVVCLMSGEFTQRGEPAVCDKWTRARLAIAGGADVVLELPFLSAVRSAERFATGAVRILDAVGAGVLSFGAETPDLAQMCEAAEALNSESDAFRSALREALSSGLSYAGARRQAARVLPPQTGRLLTSPNNVLAIEYLRALQRTKSPIQPLAVQREGASHDGAWTDGEYPSAAAVREALYAPGADCAAVCRAAGVPGVVAPCRWHEPLFTLIAGTLRRSDAAALRSLADMEPGLEWRLPQAARKARSFSQFVDLASTKRYPPARIKRLALYALFGVTRRLTSLADGSLPPCVHVLGVRKDAMEKFGRLCKRSAVPITASPKPYQTDERVRLGLAAGDLYGLLTDPVRPAGADFTTALQVRPAPDQ